MNATTFLMMVFIKKMNFKIAHKTKENIARTFHLEYKSSSAKRTQIMGVNEFFYVMHIGVLESCRFNYNVLEKYKKEFFKSSQCLKHMKCIKTFWEKRSFLFCQSFLAVAKVEGELHFAKSGVIVLCAKLPGNCGSFSGGIFVRFCFDHPKITVFKGHLRCC